MRMPNALLSRYHSPDRKNLATLSVKEMLMPAYWIARSKINDPVEYKKYADLIDSRRRLLQATAEAACS
jgi:hypothetical protein